MHARPGFGLTLAVLAALAAPHARAEFGGNLSTIARAYDSLQTIDGVQRVRSWRPIDQYARLTWDDLGPRRAWTIDTSVRLRLDWGTGTGTDDHDFDVMIARAGWTSRGGLVGIQLGRIQSLAGFGWKAFDGARLDFAKLPNLRVSCFAGLPVEFADGGEPDVGSFTWGAGVTGVMPGHGSFGVDYELRKFGDATTEESAGLDVSLRFEDTEISANADYSLLFDSFGESTLAIGQDVAGRHHVEARATRVEPIWSADSIFAVFDINPFTELRLSYEFHGGEGLVIGGYASREDYQDTALPGPQDIRRAAVTARWGGRRRALHRSEIGWLDGWTGSRVALRHDSDWSATSRLRVGAGASMQDFRNFARLTDRDQIWSLRGRIAHDHYGRWNVGLEVEQFLGRDRDTMRGLLTFGTRFGSARRERPWWGGRASDAWTPPPATRSDAEASKEEVMQ